MSTVHINGREITVPDGSNIISIVNNRVLVNGVEWSNVTGHVSAGGSVRCGDVSSSVNAGGSVRRN